MGDRTISDLDAQYIDEALGEAWQGIKDIAEVSGFDLDKGTWDPTSIKRNTLKVVGGKLVEQIDSLAENFYDIGVDALSGPVGQWKALVNLLSTEQCIMCCVTAALRDLHSYNCKEDCSRKTLEAVYYKVHVSKYLDRCLPKH